MEGIQTAYVKITPIYKNTHKIRVPRIEYTPNRKGRSRFWTDTDEEMENESSDKEVCLTGNNHKLNKEWIHVDKLKKRYRFTNKGTRCKSWVDYRDYHRERQFMFDWLHPKKKIGKGVDTEKSVS